MTYIHDLCGERGVCHVAGSALGGYPIWFRPSMPYIDFMNLVLPEISLGVVFSSTLIAKPGYSSFTILLSVFGHVFGGV